MNVTTDPEQTPSPPGEHPAPTLLVLELRLSPGADLDGSVGRPAETERLSFHGWIAFMSALNTLRATATPAVEPPD
jgi:hypothetical protein